MVDGVPVKVLYDCHGCELKDREVSVRERGQNEDIRTWFDAVRAAVYADHSIFSPRCRSNKCDLKIPLTGDPEKNPDVRIGTARRQ